MKTVVEGALRLRVEETDQILTALNNAKVLKGLTGRQRQHMEDAIANLTEARKHACQEWVEVPTEVAVTVLRCVALTQMWLGEMFEDFGSVGLD